MVLEILPEADAAFVEGLHRNLRFGGVVERFVLCLAVLCPCCLWDLLWPSCDDSLRAESPRKAGPLTSVSHNNPRKLWYSNVWRKDYPS